MWKDKTKQQNKTWIEWNVLLSKSHRSLLLECSLTAIYWQQKKTQYNEQCFAWVVRWPCSILAIDVKHFLMGKQYF